MAKKLYGAAAAAHAKKQGKRGGAKKGAKKGTKKSAAHHGGSYLKGYHDGHSDVRAGRPLRKVGSTKYPYSRGYRAGVREARSEK